MFSLCKDFVHNSTINYSILESLLLFSDLMSLMLFWNKICLGLTQTSANREVHRRTQRTHRIIMMKIRIIGGSPVPSQPWAQTQPRSGSTRGFPTAAPFASPLQSMKWFFLLDL